jgi:hypothetical protein
VVKLADTLVLGTSALARAGSSPAFPTNMEISMRIIKAYLTRRANGLYMLTYLPPVIHEVGMTKTMDAYITYGDALGINNLCEWFAEYMFGVKDLEPLTSVRVKIIGEKIEKTLDKQGGQGV